MTDSQYVLAGHGADAEATRLALLEQIYDPGTTRRLDALGLGEGARCLEVGAGGGSIARWLSDRVGPDGQVVAADIDCRFLHDLPDNVEVRQLDITAGDLETDHYDLVHCRAVLNHVPDPLGALRRMVAALRPGGVLLAEEGDFGTFGLGGHPDARWASEVTRRIFDGWASAKILNSYLGRDLAAYLSEAGLAVLGGDLHGEISRHSEPWSRMWNLTMQATVPGLAASGSLNTEEAERLLQIYAAPQTVLTSFADVAAWGRRPR